MSKRDSAANLRQAAEARLNAAVVPIASGEVAAEYDLRRTVHELQVHKIELEMQNSELRQSRAEHEEALARYTELYDFAPVGYLTLSADGLIAEVNLTCCGLLGMSRRELLKKEFSGFVVCEERERWARFLANFKSCDGKIQVELGLRRGDGGVFPAQIDGVRSRCGADGATVLPAGDNPSVSLVLADISVRRGIETKLQEAVATAEKANRAKTQFLSSMSHELRTPLNSILGFAQLMESSTPPPTPPQRLDLDRILKAGWYLLELINEVLDLSLIESGKAMLSQEPVSMADVMFECRALIEPQAERRGIALKFPECRIACCIYADRIRVKQVLVNLLFNAVKYNRPGGHVSVACNSSTTGAIRISVRDTGAGLTPQQLADLFQPFNRLGQEGGAEEGTGIGLVVSKRLVEMMGGRIGANSTVGAGSEFWIELPRASVAPFAAPAAQVLPQTIAQASPGHGVVAHTVLCIEDNPCNLELVERLLARRPDTNLLTAADGKLGIDFARAYQPHVILMDVSLPDMSGRDALAVLRTDPATAHIPVIALSANAMPADVAKGMEAGFFRYITKPILIGEFMNALDTALQLATDQIGGKTNA